MKFFTYLTKLFNNEIFMESINRNEFVLEMVKMQDLNDIFNIELYDIVEKSIIILNIKEEKKLSSKHIDVIIKEYYNNKFENIDIIFSKSILKEIIENYNPYVKIGNDYHKILSCHMINIFSNIITKKNIKDEYVKLKDSFNKKEYKFNNEEINNFNTYITKVFKCHHPETKISLDAKKYINIILNKFCSLLGLKISELTIFDNKKIIGLNNVLVAMNLIIDEELMKYISSICNKEHSKYITDGKDNIDVIFPPNKMRKYFDSKLKIGYATLLYFTSSIDYICSEICEHSGNICKDKQLNKVSENIIDEFIMSDNEIKKTFQFIF